MHFSRDTHAQIYAPKVENGYDHLTSQNLLSFSFFPSRESELSTSQVLVFLLIMYEILWLLCIQFIES